MQTYLEMQTELTSRLGVASSSTKFPSSRIQTLIKDAHMWATALYPFRQLTTVQTITSDGGEDFPYPDAIRIGSIWAIYVNDLPFRKKRWEDYLEWKRLYPSSTKRIFAELGTNYYIHPTPAAGLDIDTYGQVRATQLSADGDLTIFSNSNEEGNEAIVLKAMSVAKNDPNKAAEAVALLTKIFADQKDSSQFEQPLNKQLFDVPDFFAGYGGSVMNRNWSNSIDEDDY